LVLRLNQETDHRFWCQTGRNRRTNFEAKLEKIVVTDFGAKPAKTVAAGFEAKPLEIIATVFEAKPVKIVTVGFDAKPVETITTGFEAKPVKTVWVVLRQNHSQTVNLSFKAQPRNPRSYSPRARCRPHTAPPDLSTARLPSARPVRPSPIFCTRSATPITVFIVARHTVPATYTPWDMQTWFSKWNKDKRKTKWNCLRFKFKTHQVNNSS
jgi:hypothetical protein